MSRLFRFLLLPAGAGALVAFSRRRREQPQPIFADIRPAQAQAEPVELPVIPFVADIQKPSSAQTDTWSGRAVTS